MMLTPIYLDANATTPLSEDLKQQIPGWLTSFGNPSSIHWAGRGPKGVLRDARRAVAGMIGAEALELIFTSGGSEANNLALVGVLEHLRLQKSCRDQLIVSAVEHPSVLKTAQYLARFGWRVNVVPVSRNGVLDIEIFKKLLSERTALVSTMLANNETGHIFPVREMAALAHEVGARFHCDAVQALGKKCSY